jgi:hypothetical protein
MSRWWRVGRSSTFAWLAVSLLACGNGAKEREVAPSPGPAGVPAARTIAARTPREAIAPLRAVGPASSLLARASRPSPQPDGFRVARAPHAGWVAPPGIVTTLPRRADGATRVALEATPEVWIEIRPRGAASVAHAEVDGALVALDASPETDVVMVADATSFEELRVLRGPAAPKSAEYELRVGPGVADVRAIDGRVEVVDRRGLVRLVSDVAWAIELASSLTRAGDARTLRLALPTGAYRYPIVVDPGWKKTTTSLSHSHRPARAFTLPSGKVLVVGEADTTPDLWDPAVDYFFAAGKPADNHGNGVAAQVPDGTVFLLGGYGVAGETRLVEAYDAAADKWTTKAQLPDARSYAAVTTLAGPKLFVSGGYSSSLPGALKLTRIYDVGGDAWSNGPDLKIARQKHEQVALPDGRVVIAGGYDGTHALSLAEIYDPVAATTALVASMHKQRKNPTAIGIAGGKVLVAGGSDDAGYVSTSEIYDPTANTWTEIATAGAYTIASGTGVVALPSGRILSLGYAAVGGCNAATWIFDPANPSAGWTSAGNFAGAVGAVCETRPTLLTSGTVFALDAYTGNAGLYVEALANGAACTSSFDCVSGNCVDGVCCDTACAGACQACNVTGKVGTCSTAPAGKPVGARSCPGAGACQGTCDGALTVCVLPGVATECKAARCASDTFTAASHCDGAGGCVDATTATACAPYACTATGCKTTCASQADCAAGLACSGGVCGAPSDAGSDAGDAGSDAIVEAGADAIADAPAPPVPAKPTVGDVQRCAHDAECGTGHCVEGICCDTACEERCHSCALLGTAGKCTLEPIGVDLKNDCGAALSCTGTCDGAGQCIGAGAGTQCERTRCIGPTTGVGPAYCPAAGAKCADDAVTEFECAPYVCEPALGACRTSCGSSNDCANGTSCDVDTRSCVANAPSQADSGCAMGAGGHGGALALSSCAALALIAARRRRRRAGTR